MSTPYHTPSLASLSSHFLERSLENVPHDSLPHKYSKPLIENQADFENTDLELLRNVDPPALLQKTITRIPVSQRRGLFAMLALIPEVEEPRNYSDSTKLTIVSVVAFAGLTGPMGTSIMLPALDDVSRSLNTLESKVNITVGVYLLSLGIFPIWWLNFAERHGRRSVYVVSFSLFLAFSIGCSLAPSIEALIALRLLAGLGASAVQACGAATVADLYITEERGTALGLFYLGPLLGPFISPVMGGAVAIKWGWRATQWVMVIFCGVNVILILCLLPETLRRADSLDALKSRIKDDFKASDEPLSEPELQKIATNLSQNPSICRLVLNDEPPVDMIMPVVSRLSTNNLARILDLKQKEKELHDTNSEESQKPPMSWKTHIYDYVIRPAHALVLLTYPPVALSVAFSAVSFMGIYFFNIIITYSYGRAPYNFSTIIVGLMYIPNSVTYFIGLVFGGRWNDWLIKRSVKRHAELRPESRLSWNLVLAIALLAPACLIFGWCLDSGKFWVLPLIGSALFGLSGMLIIGVTLTYLIDILPGKGATGVAINNLTRMILAAIATFVTDPLIDALGIGKLMSIYMAVLIASSSCVYILKRKGALLREKYNIYEYYEKL